MVRHDLGATGSQEEQKRYVRRVVDRYEDIDTKRYTEDVCRKKGSRLGD